MLNIQYNRDLTMRMISVLLATIEIIGPFAMLESPLCLDLGCGFVKGTKIVMRDIPETQGGECWQVVSALCTG